MIGVLAAVGTKCGVLVVLNYKENDLAITKQFSGVINQ